jgi:hypothetical protein
MSMTNTRANGANMIPLPKITITVPPGGPRYKVIARYSIWLPNSAKPKSGTSARARSTSSLASQ